MINLLSHFISFLFFHLAGRNDSFIKSYFFYPFFVLFFHVNSVTQKTLNFLFLRYYNNIHASYFTKRRKWVLNVVNN